MKSVNDVLGRIRKDVKMAYINLQKPNVNYS